MKLWSKILLVIVLIILLVLIGFLAYGYYNKFIVKRENPIVTMEIQDYGTVKMGASFSTVILSTS